MLEILPLPLGYIQKTLPHGRRKVGRTVSFCSRKRLHVWAHDGRRTGGVFHGVWE
jgi:hypothetical protein